MAEPRRRLLLLAGWLVLFCERAWSSFWPGFSAAFAFAGLALMGVVPGATGPVVHALLLALAAAGVLYGLGRPFRPPSRADTERRMEEAGGLAHRPLSAARDAPAGAPDAETRVLWEKHAARMAELGRAARLPVPRPDAARQDRYALRHAALILLLIGVVRAGGDAPARLEAAMRPALDLRLTAGRAAVDAWITPPAYTGLGPVFLASARPGVALAEGVVRVPAGSLLKVRVDGGGRAPRLRLAGKPVPVPPAGAKSWIVETPLAASGMLRLRQGVRDLGAWRIEVTPDAPPAISVSAVEAAAQGTLKITFAADDDYGLTALKGEVLPPPALAGEPDGKPVAFDMTPPAQNGEGSFTVDLAAHPRAGEEALLVLHATDGAGNTAKSAPFPFTLPVRSFSNPLAKELIAARRALSRAKDVTARRAVAATIAGAGQDPGAYRDDIVIFLSLGSAVRRLIYDGDDESAASVRDLLWDVALKLEDGGLSVAARDLAETLDALSRALADPATPKEELQKLMDESRAAMQAYLQSLVGEMARRLAEEGPGKSAAIPPEIAAKFMKSIDLGEMMRQMQRMAGDGARGDMRKMAENLKNAIRGLSLERGGPDEKQVQSMKALEEMQAVITGQQELLDKTSRHEKDRKADALAREQEMLRHRLGEVARKLGENMKDVPENLAKADRAMKDAAQTLKEGAPRDSVPHQKRALDEMQKGMDQAVASLARDMQQMILSLGFAPGGEESMGEGSDPLGRGREKDGGKGGDLELPDGGERRRVQEIIDELRRRSNEYERPRLERDYLDRLLDQID